MAERCVDNPVQGDAKDKFASVNAGRKLRFRQQTVISGGVEFKDSVQSFLIVGEASEHRRATIGKLRGNKAVSVPLIDRTYDEHALPSAATTIEQTPNAYHGGHSAANQQLQRRSVIKHGIAVGPGGPLVGKSLAEENVQRREHSDEERDTSQFVLREQAFAIFLEFVIAAMGNAVQQAHRVFVSQIPLIGQRKESHNSGLA